MNHIDLSEAELAQIRELFETLNSREELELFVANTNTLSQNQKRWFENYLVCTWKRNVENLLNTLLENNLELVSYGLAPNPNGFCYEIHGDRPSKSFLKHIDTQLDTLTKEQEQWLKAACFF
jgi:hypothetical protein